MKNFFKYRAIVFVGLFVFGGVFLSGFYFGSASSGKAKGSTTFLNATSADVTGVDFAPFWKTWAILNEKYVPTNSTTTEAKVDDQTRVYGAIEGMVRSLGDPYTVFFPPVESKSFNEEVQGQIEGVGMEVDVVDGVLTVIAPVKGTPAFKAGVKPGDKVVKIDETSTENLSTLQAIGLIRGKRGTTVKLTIVRTGVEAPIIKNIVRDVIDLPTVDTELRGEVFVIHLYSFSAISPNIFRNALREFVESGKTKLIIDLRGNPGGYLEAAIDMASWFLPAGKTIVKEDFRSEKDTQVYRSKGYNIFSDDLKLVILIDGGSASASEILAGALHDQGVATLVGTQSFGKGSVQELLDITDNPKTSLKVTIAKWLTPKDISISHQGLTPDVVVKLDEGAFKKGVDTQLNKALEILGN